MAKNNKYTHYQVATDFEVTVSYSYREAFSLYQKADAPKTLYGIDEQGDFSTIMSNGKCLCC